MGRKISSKRKIVLLVSAILLVVLIIVVVLTIYFVGQRNQKFSELSVEIEKDNTSIGILENAFKIQSNLDQMLQNAIPMSMVEQGGLYYNDLLNDAFVHDSSVQSRLSACTKISFSDSLPNSISKIRQDAVRLDGDDRNYVTTWLKSAEAASSGDCMLSWYVIRDADYSSALDSKNSIDSIKGRLSILKELRNAKQKDIDGLR